MKQKILIIDDDTRMQEFLFDSLKGNYTVISALNATSGFSLSESESPDLILLDVNLPHLSGIELCGRIRKNPKTHIVPILMLTAECELQSKLDAFSMGADDYVEKPFKILELQARIEARLRRMRRREQEKLVCGNLALNLEKKIATIDEKEVSFSSLEFQLLQFFLRNRERVISRQEILDDIWQGVAVGHRTIDTHIVSLRKLLPKFDYEFESIYGTGYILRPKQIMVS